MAEGVDFDAWISERFRALNTDETVFVPYVKSIVEGDESIEEKVEALDGILAELADGTLDVEEFRKEILLKWDQERCSVTKEKEGVAEDDLKSKFENIMKLSDEVTDAAKDSSGKVGKSQAPPDKDLRAAILNNYRDDESDEESKEGKSVSAAVLRGGGESGSKSNLERNTNAERVLNEMKDKRDKEKADAAKKRERDKEDRAKQKQQAQERKDKAKKKAAKVERKR